MVVEWLKMNVCAETIGGKEVNPRV